MKQKQPKTEAISRTEHSAQNAGTAVVAKISDILMGYVVRIVFTHTLSSAYVGVNGLFTDIIRILSITELGVATAITFALYEPIKNNNIEKQKSLMRVFRNFYRIVAACVFGIGIALIPFLPYIMKDEPAIDHLLVIYIMYLVNSAASYLLVYKSTLIDAHQKAYLNTLYHTVAWILQDIIQIIILVKTQNFILYLLTNFAAIIISNFLLSKKAEKLYPYLKDRDVKPLPKDERDGIFKNVRAMMMHKVGTVVVNNTDNLIISAFVGVVSVGKYSNYYLVITSIRHILEQAINGMAASVGNLGVSEDRHRIKKIFEAMFFLCQWLYGFLAIAIFEVISPFVALSFGAQYVFETPVVFMLCLNFFITGMRSATLVFRDSLGLFWYDRYKAVFEAVLNIVLSIALVRNFGVAGVFAGTVISALMTSFWVEPYVLYKYRIQETVSTYFLRYGIYTAVTAVSFALSHVFADWLCGFLSAAGNVLLIETILLRGSVSVLLPNALMLLCYHRTKEFQLLYQKGMAIWKRRRSR